jgi:hypothetical protein
MHLLQQVTSFGTVCLDIRHCLVYYLYLFACIAFFWSLTLGEDDFENLQELNEQKFEQQPVGEQGK